ncbi:hypothetical protein L596_002977 [Steinernema carpocapsae]|uniref:Uncharacterized protein n=1 Tax=Steinernema carpocapsae TaxID=34508 RepID=A0A4U8URQ2_STECR|nr:hypothetical protein L596_002977 [Steinernema carpocapsae]
MRGPPRRSCRSRSSISISDSCQAPRHQQRVIIVLYRCRDTNADRPPRRYVRLFLPSAISPTGPPSPKRQTFTHSRTVIEYLLAENKSINKKGLIRFLETLPGLRQAGTRPLPMMALHQNTTNLRFGN